jgi:PAS domain S-box-containing protein
MSLPTENVEGRLRESEERYRAVIQNASDMIQSCRPDGSFEFVNNAWMEKLGYTADEVERLSVWDIIHPDSMDHCRVVFGEAARGVSLDNVRATFITKDGRAVPVEGNATSRFLGDEVIATHSFFRDITERLRSEELEQRNAELEREKLARYLEKMAALGKLSAGLAHELNNPAAATLRAAGQMRQQLTELEALAMRLSQQDLDEAAWLRLREAREACADSNALADLGPLERADREDAVTGWLSEHGIDDGWELAPGLVAAGLDESGLEELAAAFPAAALANALSWISHSRAATELLETIATSARSISDLVGAVKEYSYMDRAPEQEVDIHDGLENTLRILDHKLKAGTRLVRDFDRSLPRVVVLASELNQVWTNLIDNAIDAAGPEGEVRIRTFRDGDRIAVEIADNGGGIPAEIQSRIFDPFFTTKDVGRGTGLGLDVARRIVVERSGGELDFQSMPGDTRFWVRLPLRLPGGNTEGQTPGTAAPSASESHS